MKRVLSPRFGYPAAVISVLAAIAVLRLLGELTAATHSLILLVTVFVVARVWESGPGVLAAILGTLGLNYFFLPPVHTLTVEDPRNVVALLVFLGSALVVGRLSATSRLRLRQLEAERRDLIALTRLSQAFLTDTNRESLLAVAAERLRNALEASSVGVWLVDESSDLTLRASSGQEESIRNDLRDLAFRQGSSASFPAGEGGQDFYLPIRLGVQPVGTLVALGVRVSERMVEGCAGLLAVALEREKFVRLARTAEEIRAREEIKSTLLATLAHDLKTPVTGARMAIENLDLRTGGTGESREARDAINRLTRLIDDLLHVVRLESGTTHPARERVSCNAILEAAVARFGELLVEHTFQVEMPRAETYVEVDPAQITEAVGLGLENAARHTPPGSRVRLSAQRQDGVISLQVEDAGPGIPEADRERALQKFVRLGATEAPGSGLGLYIARTLVEMNGGNVRLGNSSFGGAVFEILLAVRS